MDMTALPQLLVTLIGLLEFILVARVLLSWFPAIDWYSGPFKILKDITDPILKPFQMFIPPIGGLDISPIVACLVLRFLANIVGKLSFTGGMNLPG